MIFGNTEAINHPVLMSPAVKDRQEIIVISFHITLHGQIVNKYNSVKSTRSQGQQCPVINFN